MIYFSFPTCYKCGGNADIPLDDGSSAVCYGCDDAFQAAMGVDYPLGQCDQCGAAYQAVTCPLGQVHTVAYHAEGACGSWSDSPDTGAFECSYGCRRLGPAPVTFSLLDDLPF